MRPECRDQGCWCLLHANAPSHKASILREFLTRKAIVALDHLPCSPHLAPCPFSLFPKLKIAMKEKRHDTIPTRRKASTEAMKAIPVEEFVACFAKYRHRLQCCIYPREEYFKEIKITKHFNTFYTFFFSSFIVNGTHCVRL